jgi:hypothetical protein
MIIISLELEIASNHQQYRITPTFKPSTIPQNFIVSEPLKSLINSFFVTPKNNIIY